APSGTDDRATGTGKLEWAVLLGLHRCVGERNHGSGSLWCGRWAEGCQGNPGHGPRVWAHPEVVLLLSLSVTSCAASPESPPRATLTAKPGSCRGGDGTAGLRHAVSGTGSGAHSGRNDQSFQDGVRRRRTHPGGLDEQPSAWCPVREPHERLLDHRSHLRQPVREGVAVGGLA